MMIPTLSLVYKDWSYKSIEICLTCLFLVHLVCQTLSGNHYLAESTGKGCLSVHDDSTFGQYKGIPLHVFAG